MDFQEIVRKIVEDFQFSFWPVSFNDQSYVHFCTYLEGNSDIYRREKTFKHTSWRKQNVLCPIHFFPKYYGFQDN
jgi:hypothetical protein